MKLIEIFFVIALSLVIACGFVFFWHTWNKTRSRLALVLSILTTVLVCVIIAFCVATLCIYLFSL